MEMQSDMAVFQLLTNALQASDLKQKVYANNIANVNTPGYKREDVSFDSVLQQAMTNTGVSALGQEQIPLPSQGAGLADWSGALQVQPTVVQDNSTTVDNNGNNVDIDAEMADLAENQIKYQTLTQDLQSRISRLQTAITS
jgi:flagellar basal-body rod protein FlgB